MTDACRFEREVLRAARENRWTEALRQHAAGCDACAAALSVAPWMDQFSRFDERRHILPDPSIVWLKATLMQGNLDAARIARPLNVVQLLAYLVVASGWAAVLTWKWAAVQAWVRSMTPTGIVVHSTSAASSLSISFFAIIFVLASVTVMVAMHTILTED